MGICAFELNDLDDRDNGTDRDRTLFSRNLGPRIGQRPSLPVSIRHGRPSGLAVAADHPGDRTPRIDAAERMAVGLRTASVGQRVGRHNWARQREGLPSNFARRWEKEHLDSRRGILYKFTLGH